MVRQNTKFKQIQQAIASSILLPFDGPWKIRSLGLLSLLLGYYLSSNIASYFINKQGERLSVLIIMLLIIEILIRIRPKLALRKTPPFWIAIDNVRIGATYAIVLEAFKLGS
tara:strand:+ start:1811 stop:2146 length:336 start_codon:yes stop_codon:yes gene_type:complete